MRTLRFGLRAGDAVFRANVSLPDEYFDGVRVPLWHKLNARFSAPGIIWDKVIGCMPEPVVNKPAQHPPIGDELKKLREVVTSLEKKFDGVVGQ